MSLKKVVLASLLIDSKPGFASGDDLEEGVFQIRMNNITRDGTLDIAKRRRVSVDEKKLCSVLLNVDDVLFNATNSPDLVGKSAYIGNLDEPTTYSNHFVRLRSDPEKLDGSYLARWLHTLFQAGKFKGLCKQWVNQATVSRDSLLALEIPLPSLPEQRRIAAILDQAETLRTQRRTALALLDNLTQSLFLDMFGDGLTNPHDWPTQSIDSVCELVVDCVNRTAPVVEEPTPYKMIRTTNVKGGNVDLSSVRHVSAEIFKDWNRRATPRRGDVLLTREAPVGEAGILATNDNVFLGQRLMLYRPALNRLTSEYLLYSFMSPYLQLQFNRHGAGSTVKHLPLPACRAFELRIPPFPLQQTFATRIASIEALKATHRHALAALDALFASLQQRAFSGELTLAAPRASAQSLDQLQQLEASIGQEALIFIAKRMPDGDLYNSLKAIYFADRHHLEHYGHQIYNETYCALPHGPVPQSAYDATRVLIGERMFSDFDDDAMRAALRRNDKKLTALRDADFSKLSRSVVESLEWAVRYCSDMKFGQTKTASHDSAYERTPKNETIPLQYIIDTLPPEARQRHWNL